MLTTAKKATCHTFLCALAFASLASGQVVEKARTWADLNSSHPCDTGLTGRLARVTDCDAADDVGDGAGAFNCWVSCDGSAPWVTQAIGAGGGGLPGADEVTESMLKVVNACTDEYVLTCETTTGDFEWQAAATGTIGGSTGATDNAIPRADGTGGFTLQGSLVTIDDTTGVVKVPFSAGGGFGANVAAKYGLFFGASGEPQLLSNSSIVLSAVGVTGYKLRNDAYWGWSSTTSADGSGDTGLMRAAAGVINATAGPSGEAWVNQAGNVALAADFTSTSATPANLTGITVTLKASRKYIFRMALRFSDSTAADGARFDFDGGTATATDFGVNCQVYDSTLLHVIDATALATDLVATTTTGASSIKCDGSFTVNAAGTFIVRAGQEAASGGTLTVETGSYLQMTDTSFN